MGRFTLAAAIAATLLTAFVPTVSIAQNQEKPEHLEEDTCGSELGYLRQVFPEQIAAVDNGYRVWVNEVCLNSDRGPMRSEGNAGKLRGAIADNDVLVAAPAAKNYTPEDVVGVRMMGEDTITLYVHPFHR